MSCAYFVSDIHLTSAQDSNFAIFSRFLSRLLNLLSTPSTQKSAEAPTHLFLVGDIFDLWIADHRYFTQEFEPLVYALQQLHAKGVEIHYFEGNHDLHLRKFWQNELGFQVHREAAYFDLGSQVVRVEHGDQMNPNDRGYLFLRWLLRTPVLHWLSHRLPAFVVKAIGERASGVSREYTSTRKELPRDQIHKITRHHAQMAHQQKSFDLIISGHVHVVDDHTFQVSAIHRATRSVRSVNLGSWYDRPTTFILSDEGGRFIDLDPALT